MLNQKTAFVTGAASGIGFEIALKLAEGGAKVALADINHQAIQQAALILCSMGYQAIGIGCDITHEDQIVAAIKQTRDTFGPIDILINSAGLQYISPIENFPVDKFEYLLKVMLTAPFITTKHVFAGMKERLYGRIINISSINGLIGFEGKAAYNSAKHGLIGLTKVAALEGAKYGITVNAICPGYVDTPLVRNQMAKLAKARGIDTDKVLEEVIYPLVPQQRLLTTDEIAAYVLFIAGEQAGGITGQAIVIDGGYTAQ